MHLVYLVFLNTNFKVWILKIENGVHHFSSDKFFKIIYNNYLRKKIDSIFLNYLLHHLLTYMGSVVEWI